MPVNDFEKQVQQKMEELQLRPSAEVWTEVEKQIRKDKRKRRVFFWWLLPVIITGGLAAWWLLPSKDKSTGSISTTNTITPKEISTGKNASTSPITNQESKPVVKNGPTSNSKEKDRIEILNKTSASSTQSKKYVDNISKKDEFKIHTSKNISTIKPVEPIKELKTIISENPNYPLAEPKESVSPDTTVILKVPVKDSVSPPLQVNKQVVSLEEKLVEAGEKEKEGKKNRKKWNFGIELSPGLSATVQGSLFPDKALTYSGSPVPSAGSGSYTAPFAPPVLISSPSAGYSATLELFAQRELSSKLSIKTGINYSYISTRVNVGSRVEAQRQVNNDISSGVIIESYYRADYPGNDQDYTNSFHLVGVIAKLSWKVIDQSKVKLYWENGLGVSRLLSTNALLFDNGIRGYYKDINAFSKTQVFLSSSLDLPLINGKQKLLVGPYARYGLTPVLKTSNDPHSHFLQYGASVKFLW